MTSLLIDSPDNLESIVIDLKREEKGFLGLCKFAFRIRREKYDDILDFHDVIRSKIIRSIASIFSKTKCVSINKHRKQRRELINKKSKLGYKIPSMMDIYSEAISKTTLNIPLAIETIEFPQRDMANVDIFINSHIDNFANVDNIGIAPFASKRSKNISFHIIEGVIKKLINDTKANIILFSSKGKESDMLQRLTELSSRVVSIAGKINLNEEIGLISRLDCMVSMDSANMHFASMVGVPVVSLWAGTTPDAGFLGLYQDRDDALEAENIDCSPCSIFGTDKCIREDFACCDALQVDNIICRIKNHLKYK